MFRLNLAPVAAINIGFGGDNHYDGLGATQLTQSEVPGHKNGIGALSYMAAELKNAGMTDNVSFLLSNVFGRNLAGDGARNGRGHNSEHAVSLMYGPTIKDGVVGGVQAISPGGDYMASAVSSTSGQGGSGGDIAYKDTLASMGKTFTSAVGGITEGVIFRAGTVVKSVLPT